MKTSAPKLAQFSEYPIQEHDLAFGILRFCDPLENYALHACKNMR